jgi:hypothetical protein
MQNGEFKRPISKGMIFPLSLHTVPFAFSIFNEIWRVFLKCGTVPRILTMWVRIL